MLASSASLAYGALAPLIEVLVATRLEICLFLVAVLAYFALFGNVMPKGANDRKLKFKRADDSSSPCKSPQDCDDAERALKAAHDSGDFKAVLSHWSTLKRATKVSPATFASALEAMQRARKDSATVLRELKMYLNKNSEELDIHSVNDVLDTLAKRMNGDLMRRIVDLLLGVGLAMDERTYEIFLSVHFSTRQFEKVQDTIAEMKAKEVPFTTRATIVVIKTALKTSNFDEARSSFRELMATWSSSTATPSMAPKHIVSQLVDLACKEHQLRPILPELTGAPITEEAVNMMLNECTWQRDAQLALDVEKMAKDQKVDFSDRSYSLLLKALGSDIMEGQRVLDEAVSGKESISADLALSAISFCGHAGDVERVDKIREKVKHMQASVLAAFIKFYVQKEQFSKACDLYESIKAADSVSGKPSCLDSRLERVLMQAALRCGRSQLASGFLESSPADVAKHITMIRNCAAERNLPAAIAVFESLKKNAVEMNSVIYNTVIDACVECRDLKAAEHWMKQTKEAGMADVVSFNTLIKAHLADGSFAKARGLMAEMTREGMHPNRVTFNEFLNALVSKGKHGSNRSEIWSLLDEMQQADVKPNQVTCSILMKGMSRDTAEQDLAKTMELISCMEEPMDEVLLSSVVEACVRTGKPDLVATKLRQLQGKDTALVNGSHTFGSLIKAYGFARDIEGVWRCWQEMRSRHIRPTSVTLGCMVEAVVNNGDTEGAYELIQDMRNDEHCRDVLNSVIYCSVLKGFAREKKIERAWAVYEEMCSYKVELSIVTYNTLIDACARCGRMERTKGILEDMEKYKIKSNVITYSTMLKGYCQSGDMQTAFALLKRMRSEGDLKPDEIMYNSLLDGCAQNNLVDEGLRLLSEMEKEGIAPSNFTLSVLVKMMSRARRLDSAFDLVEQITAKYKFRLNVHVYTNLIQACISNRSLLKAINVLERMLNEKVAPENRTYSILIRAYMQQGNSDQVAGLLRGALGLEGALPLLASHQVAVCHQLDSALVNETLMGLASKPDLVIPLLSEIRQQRPRVRIEASTQRRLMCQSSNQPGPSYSSERAAEGHHRERGERGGQRLSAGQRSTK